ncbi:MAG: hypothetical protein IKM97_03385 [Clostridia bacterium]|nr:hypothetical protein [Clostridia bacterium]
MSTEYGLVTLILSIILKEYKKEYALYVSLIGRFNYIIEQYGNA